MPQWFFIQPVEITALARSEICLFVSNEARFDKLNPPHEVHYNIAFNEAQVSNRDSTVIKRN
jgi:hypothetical protein